MGKALAALALTACVFAPRADSIIEGRVWLAGPGRPGTTDEGGAGSGSVTAARAPRAVVYLTGISWPCAEKTVRLVARSLAFDPPILPIQVGTRVEFVNEDPVAHGLFSYSAAKRFELGVCRSHDPRPMVQAFEAPGLVTVRCDEHAQMRGLILVLETPYFATVDENGRFGLSGLPGGDFTVTAWWGAKNRLERRVSLKENSRVSLDFEFPLGGGSK